MTMQPPERWRALFFCVRETLLLKCHPGGLNECCLSSYMLPYSFLAEMLHGAAAASSLPRRGGRTWSGTCDEHVNGTQWSDFCSMTSLNALHDTASGLGCSDADGFVMSASLSFPSSPASASNPWTFSSCSATTFDNFLNSGWVLFFFFFFFLRGALRPQKLYSLLTLSLPCLRRRQPENDQ